MSGRVRPGIVCARGQTMVEFAMVLPLALLLLLTPIQVGLWAISRDTATTAAETGVRVAAGAVGSAAGEPAISRVYGVVRDHLRSGLVGASVDQRQPVAGRCPDLDAAWPVGVVYVCAVQDPAARTVAVAVRGWMHALVPPSFGLASWRPGALPVDVSEVVHEAVFAP